MPAVTTARRGRRMRARVVGTSGGAWAIRQSYYTRGRGGSTFGAVQLRPVVEPGLEVERHEAVAAVERGGLGAVPLAGAPDAPRLLARDDQQAVLAAAQVTDGEAARRHARDLRAGDLGRGHDACERLALRGA